MSSMFKKKGGPAFKPKIPSARARPAAAAAASSQPARPPQSQPSIDSQSQAQSQSASQEPDKTTSPETSTTQSAVPRSQDPLEPPRQKSPTPTPPEQVSDSAKPDSIPSAEELPRDGLEDPNTGSAANARESSGQDINAITPAAAPESTPIGSEQAHPNATSDGIAPETTPIDSSNDSQTDTVPSTEVPTSTIDASRNESETENFAPGESSEATSQAPSLEPATKPATRPRTRRQTAARSNNEQTGEEDQSARPKKRQRKTAQKEGDDAPKPPRKRKTPSGDAQPRRRARSITPEDSETQVVDLQQLKMSDLTRDLHIGKKFSRHDELRERERRARLKSKLGDEERDDSATPEPGAKTDSPAAPPTPTPSSDPAPASGPQFRIVDGQIVIDQSSLAVDRHARDAARLGDMETVEENDFTRLITSNSFMNTSKLKGPNIWTDAETELFYRGLRMFGTDFEMISKMFPGKQRRHVKLKYNREERHCPRRIDAAVMGEKTVKMDIDEYKAFTGTTFESVESIEAEQRKRQEDFEAEQKRIADEQAEIMRKKREELFAENDEDLAKKKKGKKGKQKVIYGLNGEPIGTES